MPLFVPRGLLPSVPRMVSSWSIETNASAAITATSLAPLAPDYDDGGMDKCDMCLSLGVDDTGRPTPHCVATCPTQALYFGTKEEIDQVINEKEAARALAHAEGSAK